jgi:hypothetical protein
MIGGNVSNAHTAHTVATLNKYTKNYQYYSLQKLHLRIINTLRHRKCEICGTCRSESAMEEGRTGARWLGICCHDHKSKIAAGIKSLAKDVLKYIQYFATSPTKGLGCTCSTILGCAILKHCGTKCNIFDNLLRQSKDRPRA